MQLNLTNRALALTFWATALLNSAPAHADKLFDELPRCETRMTIYYVREGLDAAGPMRVMDVFDAKELVAESGKVRTCKATAVTDIDHRQVIYEIGWEDAALGIPYFRGEMTP